MTENTDKASRKAGKAASKGQRGKGRSPKRKRAKSPDGKTPSGKPFGNGTPADKNGAASAACPQTGQAKAPSSPTAKSPEPKSPEPKSLAPDPATVTFGRNRPIVATPRKLPEGSGLRFTGPSLGELKASGPQRSSAKASGLTFASVKGTSVMGTSAKSTNGQGTGSSKPSAYGPAPRRAENAKAEPAKSAPTKNGPTPAGPATTGGRMAETAAPSSRVPASGTKTADKNAAKPAPLTKPAIAPQASIRRLDKERSFSGFVLTLLGLLVTVGALAFWMNSGPSTAPHTPMAQDQVAQDQAAPGEEVASATRSAAIPAAKTEEPAPVNLAPSVRAPVSPGPLVAAPSTAAPESAPGFTTDLSLEQIAEVQKLLDRLGLVPGNLDGILTSETQEAIRSYQEMAGLPADGGADMALLEELRTVAELYGS